MRLLSTKGRFAWWDAQSGWARALTCDPHLLPHRRCATIRHMRGEVHTGECLCGAVRYSVSGDPIHVARCHCADCRKESGSAFSVYAQWPVEMFEMTGEIASYDGRGFCPRCGSRLLDC